ncbi:MAG: family 16 glycosylhydrolase [Erythrobacter sp.]
MANQGESIEMKYFLILAGAAVLVSGCGPDDNQLALATAPPVPVAITPSLSAPAVASVPSSGLEGQFAGSQTAVQSATTNPFANFDFKGGSAYPALANVRIGDVKVPVGATEAHVPITLDRPTPNTVIVLVVTRNGSGAAAGVSGRHYTPVDTWLIFRPGDVLMRTVCVPLANIDAGRNIGVYFADSVYGGINADGNGVVTAVVGAPRTTAVTTGFRSPRTFASSGTLAYQLDPATVAWSDAGGTNVFTTRLPHGRTQIGNGETGLYLDPVLHRPSYPPFSIEKGEMVIRSQQLLSPILHDGCYWYHGAAMLTGQKMPATQIRYGQYEWSAKMPNRRGAWPALWLGATKGWPPEIDVYEGFGYNSWWNFGTHYAANIHGGSGGNRTFTALMQINIDSIYEIKGIDTGYHRFAVDIAPDYITWFIDGREVYQTVNAFKGTTWYPLMNVAVKHQGTYSGGFSEMRVRSFKVWNSPG